MHITQLCVTTSDGNDTLYCVTATGRVYKSVESQVKTVLGRLQHNQLPSSGIDICKWETTMHWIELPALDANTPIKYSEIDNTDMIQKLSDTHTFMPAVSKPALKAGV